MEAVGEQLSSRNLAFWALQTVIYLHEELKGVQRGKKCHEVKWQCCLGILTNKLYLLFVPILVAKAIIYLNKGMEGCWEQLSGSTQSQSLREEDCQEALKHSPTWGLPPAPLLKFPRDAQQACKERRLGWTAWAADPRVASPASAFWCYTLGCTVPADALKRGQSLVLACAGIGRV